MKAVKTLIREKNILENNDLLLVSHLDELLSRDTVHLVKHCHLKHSFAHGALIMPMGNMNFAFRSPERSFMARSDKLNSELNVVADQTSLSPGGLTVSVTMSLLQRSEEN